MWRDHCEMQNLREFECVLSENFRQLRKNWRSGYFLTFLDSFDRKSSITRGKLLFVVFTGLLINLHIWYDQTSIQAFTRVRTDRLQ